MKHIFYNAKVYTGNDFVEAFVVQDNRFIYVGDNDNALSLYEDGDIKTDLNNQFVCAGFNDSHLHLLNLGQALSTVTFYNHTSSVKDMMDHLKEYVETRDFKDNEWIRGRGWNQDYFTDGNTMPSRKDIDNVCKDIPVMLSRVCGHVVVANTKAMELAGINENTIAPEGGRIDYENGLFFDNAIPLIKDHIPLPDSEQLKSMILEASKYLNSMGITSVQSDDYHTFNGLDYEEVNKAYKQLEQDNLLTVRVYEQSHFRSLDTLKQFIEAGYNTGKGSDMYKIGPLKMVADGSLGSRTAALVNPYNDDPNTKGLLLFTDKQINEMVDYANSNNMQVAIHAIGDKCLDQVLNAIDNALKNNPRDNHRYGIVHCQISRSDQLQRMIDMKLHIYAQSIFLDYDNHIVEQRVGKELASTSYNWKTLYDNGLVVSNGSDAPVEYPDVMKGLECAVTRTSIDGTGPYLIDQAFSVKQALDSFTINGAIASFEENNKGLIKENYLADFVILDNDPFTCDKKQIHNIRILKTYLNGKQVY